MPIDRRTLAQLARSFEGGSGPTRSSAKNVFENAGAGDYFSEDGNKYDTVMNGLTALLRGSPATAERGALTADAEMLEDVAGQLAALLNARDELDDETTARILDGPAPASPAEAPDTGRRVTPPTSLPSVQKDGPIFVVHGHAEHERTQVQHLLERTTDREVTVLHEQPNAGNTLIEKFEKHASSAAFAVVLLTADDLGGPAGGGTRSRGRQNVIFELGFFFGRLGRHRVAVLLHPDVERPSDIDGLIYIPMGPADWKLPLLRELAEVKITIDYSRIP